LKHKAKSDFGRGPSLLFASKCESQSPAQIADRLQSVRGLECRHINAQGHICIQFGSILTSWKDPGFFGVRPISAAWHLNRTATWFLSALIVLTCAVLMARTVWFLDRGFDFTDDSFYLMTIQWPSSYKWNYGLFGYALKPLYVLAGESVASLRRICAFVLVGLGATAGLVVLNKMKLSWRDPSWVQILAVFAVLPLCYYSPWIPSPSYNWLAAVGGLTLFIAILLLHQPSATVYSAFCAAAAGALAFFGRPHSAVSFGVLYLTAVLIALPTMKARVAQIVWAGALTILVAFVVAVFLPIGAIYDQIKEYNTIFGTSHPVRFSTLDRQVDFLLQGKTWLVSALLFVSLIFMRRGGRNISSGLTAALIAAALAIISAAILSQILHPREYDFGIKAMAVAFSVLTLACLKETINVRLIMLLAVTAVIPFAATAGSSNVVSLTLAQLFGLFIAAALATFVLAVQNSTAAIATASAVAVCLAFSGIDFGANSPRRLSGSLAMQVVPTQVGWGSELKLDRKTSEFIKSLRETARQGGFCKGGLAIDMTGAMPGSVFVIDGQMPVFPWIFGGYSISDYFSKEWFRRLAPERLKQSWLITGSPGSFSREELQALGVDFTAYRLVAELRHPVDDSLLQVYAPSHRVTCPIEEGDRR
jgi:hypothetical protein